MCIYYFYMLSQLLLAKPFGYMTQKLAFNLVNQNNISKRGRTIQNVLKLHTIKRTVHNRITLMPSAPGLGQISQEICCLRTKGGSVSLCADGFPAFIHSLWLSSAASSVNPGSPSLRLRLSSTTSKWRRPEKDS